MMTKLPNSWNEYANQYLELARKNIIEKTIDVNEVIPMMYISRHYIELRIKMIAKISNVIKHGNANVRGHNLKNLWENSYNLIIDVLRSHEIGSDQVIAELNNVAIFITRRTEWDDDSMAVRYPTDLNGRSYNLSDDLTDFTEQWNNCMEALEQVYHLLTESISNKKIELNDNQIKKLEENGIILE